MEKGDKIEITYPVATSKTDPRFLTYTGVYLGINERGDVLFNNAKNKFGENTFAPQNIVAGYNPLIVKKIK